MLSDREIREIEARRREGTHGPVVLTWVEKLLADRRERLQQLAHVRTRLEQAYRYLDKLLGELAPGAEKGNEPRSDGRDSRRR
jgi:hypothetical protein